MATTLMPVDPASTPQRATRLLGISASLLPEEIVGARRARRTRGWVIVIVVLVAGLLGGWFFFANQETDAADAELTSAATEVTDLQRSQREYKDVVDVQNDTATLSKQLKAVMQNDLDWAALYQTLSGTADSSGLQLDGINASLNQDNAATSEDNSLPSTSTAATVGQIVVTGTGPDKEAVASYVDLLGKQSDLANAYVTSVNSTDNGKVSFSLNVDITSAALCGRFGDKCESQGGN